MQRFNFIMSAIILLFPMTIGAVPQLLNQQGFTTDNGGVPITGSANTTFNLYTDESEGESIWTQTLPVTFDAGFYSVVLGPGTPELSTEIFDGSDLYMGVTIDGQGEFMARTKITAVPYTFMAGAVEGEVKAVGGLVVDGEEVINGQHQWVGIEISFDNIDDVPSEWADGDDLGLEGSGTDGTLAQFTNSEMADSIVVESDGKIGVGIADPLSTFHVAGSVQIADDSGDCIEGREGTIRWHEEKIEVCDGSEWGEISTSTQGQSQSQAGSSCKTILSSGLTSSGMYWIDPNGGNTSDAFQVWCRMDGDYPGSALAVKRPGSVSGQENQAGDLNLPCTPSTSGYCKLSDAKINLIRQTSNDVDAYIVLSYKDSGNDPYCRSYARKTCQWVSNGAAASGCENSVTRNSGQYCTREQTTASYRGIDGHRCPNLSYSGVASPSNPFVIFEHSGGTHYCGGWDITWNRIELLVQ